MIAFLLLLVKTVGREMVLKRPVDSRACTIAVRPKRRAEVDVRAARGRRRRQLSEIH